MRRFDLLSRSATAAALILISAGAASAQSDKLGTPNRPIYLNQSWKTADRNLFYTTSQGSQMMPYDWFLALERPDSETPFRDDNLTRFGYLPNRDKTNNPDGLPVGFVKDSNENGDWLGMTCAACHTNQINFAGRTVQIDGGPADADMWALIDEVAKALTQTSAALTDPKFKRFANKVLAANHTPADEAALFASLQDFSTYFAQFVKNSTSKVAWGRARLDAFGMIFNRATSIDLNEPGNIHEPNAPVSYPFLWDTHWHNVVQWNGSAPNKLSVERLARNVGEVLGVFAHADIKKTILPPLFFKTTAKRVNQLLIENKLSELRAPAWPRTWAPIDDKKAAEGRKLYQSYCVSCHAITPRSQPLGEITVTMTPLSVVRTDPTMARNAASLKSKSGVLEGVRMPLLAFVDPMPAEMQSLELVLKIVIGAILAPPDWQTVPEGLNAGELKLAGAIKAGQPPTDGFSTVVTSAKSSLERGINTELLGAAKSLIEKSKAASQELAYKARPLDGIWATAPYLHNGSVPNLWQLLLPAGQRVKTFYVGTREFDLVNVGFKTENTDGAFLVDTSLPGNTNTGHDGPAYGTDKFTDEQRWQLVEYLKTL